MNGKNNQDFEKRDIVEMLELDGLELLHHESDPEYYTARCPLHGDRNPSFVVYPHIQRWTCFSCKPGYHDIIDYFRYKNNWDFVTAKEHCCIKLTDDEILRKQAHSIDLSNEYDVLHQYIQLRTVFDALEFDEALKIVATGIELIQQQKHIEVIQLIKKYDYR